MPTIAHFTRSVRAADLLRHLGTLGADVSGWPEPFCLDAVRSIIYAMPATPRDRLTVDIERICAMADEVGQAALLTLPELRADLEAIDGAHARAHWAFLNADAAFRRAEEVRYADEHQNAQKLWDGFVGPAHKVVSDARESADALAAALGQVLSRDRILIDRFERSRQRAGETEREIVQITIYSEDVPEDELVIAGEIVQSRTRKPVRETSIIYDAETGDIEVVGRQRATRRQVAEAFATVMLGVKITGAQLRPRRYDLSPLLNPDNFPTEPHDAVRRVKLTRLVLSSADDRLTQIFQVPFLDEATLYEVVADQYGDENPLDGDLHPWSAEIQVEFEPAPERKRGKKLSFTITAPNKCSLRGKTAHERQLLAGHLKTWGLDCGVDG